MHDFHWIHPANWIKPNQKWFFAAFSKKTQINLAQLKNYLFQQCFKAICAFKLFYPHRMEQFFSYKYFRSILWLKNTVNYKVSLYTWSDWTIVNLCSINFSFTLFNLSEIFIKINLINTFFWSLNLKILCIPKQKTRLFDLAIEDLSSLNITELTKKIQVWHNLTSIC